MRFLIYGVVLALGTSTSYFASQTKPQGKTTGKGAVVEGIVLLKGKAAPGVVIQLQVNDDGRQQNPYLKAITDQDGKYRITGVPSGTYYAAPASRIFVMEDAKEPNGHTVVVREGETVEGIDFALRRGGVIAGKVVDVEGMPIIEQRIFLHRTEQPVRSFYRDDRFVTDDRGIYRIYGVAAGRYKIAVGNPLGFPERLSTIPQTFYPDVSDESKATIVDLAEGSELSNLNITVGRAPQTFAVSGQVIDGQSGEPIAGASFGLQRIVKEAGNTSNLGNLTTSNSKGEFKLDGLLPGKYGIYLVPWFKNLRSKVVAFEIFDQDVTGIIIKTSATGASLSGVVVLENSEDKAVWSRLLQLNLYADVENSVSASRVGISSAIGPDGSFGFDNLEQGSLRISLSGPDRLTMKGFTLSRVERNGIVEVNNIELKSGDRITDVRVVVSYGTATVQGVIKFENGRRPPESQISVRLTREGLNTPFYPEQVDQRGNFIIEGIPAGLYILEATLHMPGGRTGAPVKQEVNLSEGITTEVTITVDNPKP